MGIIKDLYNGELYPFENINPQDKEYQKTEIKTGEMKKHLWEKMSPEDQEKFEEWNRLQHECRCMEAYANFAYGFRLGIMMMVDVLAGYIQPDEYN